MLIIGITGTIGSGKGTVAEYLKTRHQFQHYSARAFIVEELERRGLPIDRNNMLAMANKFRAERGSDFIIRSLFERAAKTDQPAVIESVRSRGEAEFIHKQGGKILALDAPAELRYQRVRDRKSSTDHVSFEQFLAAEKLETTSPRPEDSNLLACIQLADIVINNHEGLPKLELQVDAAVKSWS